MSLAASPPPAPLPAANFDYDQMQEDLDDEISNIRAQSKMPLTNFMAKSLTSTKSKN
jgi:hypothetical protein